MPQHAKAKPLSAQAPQEHPLAGVWRWQVPAAGELRVLAGQVWLTRDGDAADYVLSAGQSQPLRRGDWVTLEPWLAGQVARLAWAPSGKERVSAKGVALAQRGAWWAKLSRALGRRGRAQLAPPAPAMRAP